MTSSDNGRIARNTLVLYLRMLFTLGVGLYTSRMILQALGVVDFGIYNVVGGVIAMLAFLNGSLSAATSRFITYALGEGDQRKARQVFGSIMAINLCLAGIILVIGETVGLWFVLNQLQIPAERMTAAMVVYQFSILTSMLAIVSSPYNAAIISHERMSAFAYISILDAVLKLGIVFLLFLLPHDRLIVYAILFFAIQVVDRVLYGVYCSRHFDEVHTAPLFDRSSFRQILGFVGWNLIGNLSVVCYTQGLNILLNIFFGPAVNAARGIATQVQNIVNNFCVNFQMALNPQLTKSYAAGALDTMHRLLVMSSKISYFLLFFISLPLMIEAQQVLTWWLGIVPEHTVVFMRLIICTNMVFAISNPLIISVHAVGRLKRYQIIEGAVLLSIVPISYLLLRTEAFPPAVVFVVHLCIEFAALYVRVRIILPMIGMSIAQYLRQALLPLLLVTPVSVIAPLALHLILPTGVTTFIAVGSASVISVGASIYYIGLQASEQTYLREKIQKIIHR